MSWVGGEIGMGEGIHAYCVDPYLVSDIKVSLILCIII